VTKRDDGSGAALGLVAGSFGASGEERDRGDRACDRHRQNEQRVDYFERWIGIGVDDVRDIQDVPIDQFATTDGSELPVPGVVTAVVEIEGKRVVVLDIKTVIQQVIGQGR